TLAAEKLGTNGNGSIGQTKKPITILEDVTIRFAGDSGDGMQLTGNQFTSTTALLGNDLSTLPDYPAEIRAPQGTLYGVSGCQIRKDSPSIGGKRSRAEGRILPRRDGRAFHGAV